MSRHNARTSLPVGGIFIDKPLQDDPSEHERFQDAAPAQRRARKPSFVLPGAAMESAALSVLFARRPR